MCRPNKKSPPHFFSKSHYQKLPREERKCPHCHSTELPLTVQLKLKMRSAPLQLLQMASKMSFPKPPKKGAKKTREEELLPNKKALQYKLPSGKIISAEGLPEGVEDEALEKVLTALEDKQSLKYGSIIWSKYQSV